LPLAGFASILHRVSGAGLFLLLPLLIWLLQLSLGFDQQGSARNCSLRYRQLAGQADSAGPDVGLLPPLLHGHPHSADRHPCRRREATGARLGDCGDGDQPDADAIFGLKLLGAY
jgi:hypothetical protein